MTDHQTEWSEWFLHDGKGCPLGAGSYVQVHFEWPTCGDFKIQEGILTPSRIKSSIWLWPRVDEEYYHLCMVARYRIRKPRALLDLIQMIADLPAPTQPMKTDGVIA